MKDLNGRDYAKVNEVKQGTVLEADGDFTCIEKGQRNTVSIENGRPYIPCLVGQHFLDGQLSDDGTYYVGLYKV